MDPSPSAPPAVVTRPTRVDDERLSHLLSALWKVLTRATRGSERMPALESQVSILRMLIDAGPLPPAQLADELYLARSRISNLVRDLEADGLVTREPSDTDGRSVIVTPTPYGRGVLEQFREGRVTVLGQALEGLAPDERQQIYAALPLLERLLVQLSAIADTGRRGDRPIG